MSAAYRLSVVIPTYQRCASVQQTLASLTHQSFPATQFEVVLVIDGSTDGTREMAEEFAAPYALRVHWQNNCGRAAACNAGIRLARGEIVALLDDDMDATPGFLAGHDQAHAGSEALGVLGAVPIRLHQAPPVVEYIGARFNRHMERLGRPGYAIRHRDFYSGNFSIRRQTLISAGMFDEAFRVYGNEDGELALRLLSAGVRLRFSAEALAYQRYTKDFGGLAHDNRSKGRTAVLLASKHPEIVGDLKLSAYRQGSWKWRVLRALLLRLSTYFTGTPDRIISFMHWLEQQRPRRLHLYYDLALDYYYWLGARAALREQPEARAVLQPALRIKIGGPR